MKTVGRESRGFKSYSLRHIGKVAEMVRHMLIFKINTKEYLDSRHMVYGDFLTAGCEAFLRMDKDE